MVSSPFLAPVRDHNEDAESFSSTHDPEADGGRVQDHASSVRKAERKSIAKTEDKMVRYFRWAVIAVLVLTTGVVSVNSLLILKHDQEEDFNNEFNAQGSKLLVAFYKTVEQKLGTMDSLSVAYTSYARGTGATFPNVTLPDNEIRAAGIRVLAETPTTAYFPLVTEETRPGFEAYMAENQMHYNEALESAVYQRGVQDAFFNHSDPQGSFESPAYVADTIRTINTGDEAGPYMTAPPDSGKTWSLVVAA